MHQHLLMSSYLRSFDAPGADDGKIKDVDNVHKYKRDKVQVLEHADDIRPLAWTIIEHMLVIEN